MIKLHEKKDENEQFKLMFDMQLSTDQIKISTDYILNLKKPSRRNRDGSEKRELFVGLGDFEILLENRV